MLLQRAMLSTVEDPLEPDASETTGDHESAGGNASDVAADSNADATIVSTATDAVGPAPTATGPAQGMQAGEDSSMGISQDAVGPAPPTANKKARRESSQQFRCSGFEF